MDTGLRRYDNREKSEWNYSTKPIGTQFTYEGGSYRLKQLGLEECSCMDISHNRLLSDVRFNAEKLVIDNCKKFQSNESKESIKILSLGSGGGLQDFILILTLFKVGICNIELTLIEPGYELLNINEENIKIWQPNWDIKIDPIPEKYYGSHQKELYNIIRALSLLTKYFKESNLVIRQYCSVEEMQNDKKKPDFFDVIYAIDYDGYDASDKAHDDFHSLANDLSKNGIAILSHHYLIEKFELENEKELKTFKRVAVYEHLEPEMKEGKYEYKHSIKGFFKNG